MTYDEESSYDKDKALQLLKELRQNNYYIHHIENLFKGIRNILLCNCDPILTLYVKDIFYEIYHKLNKNNNSPDEIYKNKYTTREEKRNQILDYLISISNQENLDEGCNGGEGTDE